ncbi:GNAT family N-acetyltransferase [Paenibacillus glufosinatiresistens]|uniref:GNAT family N-acetyltransferase n=1 Tax=Paenibacillus glufosinatiresistens TaxID=3070657 RepID=UPI00286DD06A|nr:GNAT family N-acetyltransferase [Paenibacillus sp. YX.27]
MSRNDSEERAPGKNGPGIVIRQAGPERAREVLELLRGAAEWMRENGLTQWKPEQFTEAGVASYFAEREVYVAEDEDKAAGVFTLQFSDPEYWGRRNDPRYAYLHRLAVGQAYRGGGLGAAMLQYAADLARHRGCLGLRLDTVANNVKLNRYYQTRGFRLMGMNEISGGKKVNLYERLPEQAGANGIGVRFFAPDDFEAFTRWTEPPEFLKQWAGPCFQHPVTASALSAYLEGANHTVESDKLVFSVFLRQTGETVGHFRLAAIDRDNSSARIGTVVLDEACRGRGIGRRIIAEAQRIGFEVLELHRLSLGVFDFNRQARATYEAAGFRTEGCQREAALFGESYVDLIEMGILDREWKERSENN